jgi:small subunit ribosomal protein S9
MAQTPVAALPRVATWTCRQCQIRTRKLPQANPFRSSLPVRNLSTTNSKRATIEEGSVQDSGGLDVRAAAPIDFSKAVGEAARVVPASPSYFTTSPRFNDHVLRLTKIMHDHEHLPTIPSDQAPRILFVNLATFRSTIDEKIGAAKYSRLLQYLRRLNQIDPNLRPKIVQNVLEEFRRPGSADIIPPRPKFIDQYGRAMGVGRRKASVARVQLIEGTGEILINGKSISEVFPRLHDRESLVWPLKVTDRLDKYNVFAMVSGGGATGQAESITLGMANALMVHEPALKPTLRKGKHIWPLMLQVADTCSWCHHPHHEARREEEDGSRQGSQEACLGEALSVWHACCPTFKLPGFWPPSFGHSSDTNLPPYGLLEG